jgi:hypothetical protein
MNNFDRYVGKVIKELNMAAGGIAQREGGIANQSGVTTPTGQQNAPTGQQNAPASTTTTTTSTTNSNPAQNQKNISDDFDKIYLDDKTKYNEILKDKSVSDQVFSDIANKLANRSYPNRERLQKLLETNPDLKMGWTKYTQSVRS